MNAPCALLLGILDIINLNIFIVSSYVLGVTCWQYSFSNFSIQSACILHGVSFPQMLFQKFLTFSASGGLLTYISSSVLNFL